MCWFQPMRVLGNGFGPWIWSRLGPLTWALAAEAYVAVKTYWPPSRRMLGLRTRNRVTRLETSQLEWLERREVLALVQVGMSASPEPFALVQAGSMQKANRESPLHTPPPGETARPSTIQGGEWTDLRA